MRKLNAAFAAPILLFVIAGCGGTNRVGPGGDDSGTSTGLGGDDGGNQGDDSCSGFCVGDATATGDDSATISSGLTITPNNSVIYIDTGKTPTAPGVQAYKLQLTDATGTTTDVTSSGTFSIDNPALGTFAGATFTSALTLPGTALGVTGTVTANAMGQNVPAKLTIVKLRKTPDATGKRDFFFTVPYEMAPDPASDVLKFATNIQKVDVALVVDTTGSMGGEIAAVQSSLQATIIPGLSAAIPSVGIAVVDHKDSSCDTPVMTIRSKVTTDYTAAENAVKAMSAGGGCDEPEAQMAAMNYTLTGSVPGLIPAMPDSIPPAPSYGGVAFRPGAVPVLVLVTDATWHDPSGSATMTNTIAAFKAHNAKFVGLLVGSAPLPQGQTLSDATGSNLPAAALGGTCPTTTAAGGNCRLIYPVGYDGSGISTSVVKAIQAISVGSTYDITYKLANDPTNKASDGSAVDATQFITQLRAMGEGSVADGCDPSKYKYTTKKTNPANAKDDTFVAVTVGTPVCFEVIPKTNTTVKAAASAQFFNAFINMVGEPGDVDLGDQRTVVFLVPPAGPGVH
jgi:hypothetical protein